MQRDLSVAQINSGTFLPSRIPVGFGNSIPLYYKEAGTGARRVQVERIAEREDNDPTFGIDVGSRQLFMSFSTGFACSAARRCRGLDSANRD
jgi:hypothetical protein